MSILDNVRKKYGIAPSGTDKTDTRASVSIVSLQNQESENLPADIEPHERDTAKALLAIMRMRERGEVPDHYTATTTCTRCGPVPIFPGVPDKVQGCPWCLNRHAGKPIPRVSS